MKLNQLNVETAYRGDLKQSIPSNQPIAFQLKEQFQPEKDKSSLLNMNKVEKSASKIIEECNNNDDIFRTNTIINQPKKPSMDVDNIQSDSFKQVHQPNDENQPEIHFVKKKENKMFVKDIIATHLSQQLETTIKKKQLKGSNDLPNDQQFKKKSRRIKKKKKNQEKTLQNIKNFKQKRENMMREKFLNNNFFGSESESES